MKINIQICLLGIVLLTTSCKKDESLFYSKGDIRIKIEAGESWIHKFPMFLGITKDNGPQFAVWLEDTKGKYISTVFVTKKIATEGWVSNRGNRRKESLPHWCYQRGEVYEDGLYLPTKKQPFTDAQTGATPKSDKEIQIKLADFNTPVVIKAEFNHSVDFNESFPKSAKDGDENYSGGEMGSGQPAVIYADTIYPFQTNAELILIGRSSSDGTNGRIYTDLEKLSTAQNIVKSINIQIVE